jgi:aspartyl-tRNA(Asn)/glutamyl-tRNA(Gln) amidotransferase subunit A
MLRNTQLFNLSGHPAISLPLPGAPLPVGLQLVGRLDDTAGLLATAAACERILNQGVPGAR